MIYIFRRILNLFYSRLVAIYERRLICKDFILLSNNCWGYELYSSARKAYNTPLVGLFMYPDCYLKFLLDLELNLESKIRFTKESKYSKHACSYPIGIIGTDIEIHFLHYENESECVSKWNRRKERLKKDLLNNVPVFAKMCDRDGCQDFHLLRFHKIKRFYRISFGCSDMEVKTHLKVKNKHLNPSGVNQCVEDGYSLYKQRYSYFDIVNWIETGKVQHTFWSRIIGLVNSIMKYEI